VSDLFARLGSTAVRSARPRPVGDPFLVDAGEAPIRSGSIERSSPAPVRPAIERPLPVEPDRVADRPRRHVTPAEADPRTRGEVAAMASADEDERSAQPPPTDPTPVAAATPSARREPAEPPIDVIQRGRTASDATGRGDRTPPADTTHDVELPPVAPSRVAARTVTARRRDPDPVFAPTAPNSRSSPVTDSGPAVRIHIGRLDVRADPESPSPARPPSERRRARPEPVSLDEYLAGRRGSR
jgi:hypothetical protein